MDISGQKQSVTLNKPNIDFSDIVGAGLKTPAFVYDKSVLLRKAKLLADLSQKTGIKFTYSIKACAAEEVIKTLLPDLAGVSVSSLFEAKLGKEIVTGGFKDKSIHITSPVLMPDDFPQIIDICDYLAFNSLEQALLKGMQASTKAKCGLRVNPGISYITDDRYDPCRPASKLGIPVQDLARAWTYQARNLAPISGLHFHTNNGSADFEQLYRIVSKLEEYLDGLLEQITWLNMGGGYFYDSINEKELGWLERILRLLDADNKGLELYMEPGEFLVGEAGYLVSSVIDLFESGGKQIAILDTSINHLPECFEYQFEPDVLNAVDDSNFEYILAGASCLAGDIFGEYCFPEKLTPGDLIVFTDAGAYSLVKANAFTGIPLPPVYLREPEGQFILYSDYTYGSFRERWRSR